MERIQPLLPSLAGLLLMVALRVGHELSSAFLPIDALPGLVTAVFVWVLVDLRSRLRDRAESRVLHELRVLAAGSNLRAELWGHGQAQRRALLLAATLLIPTAGLPGAGAAALTCIGSVTLAVAILEGGCVRFGMPDLWFALALAGFWSGASDLAPAWSNLDPWNTAAHPTRRPTDLDLGTSIRAALAQLALAFALRLALIERSRAPASCAQARR